MDAQLKPRGCQCGQLAFGDPREGTCNRCGRQVPGYETPSRIPPYSLGSGTDQSTFAKPTRKYRPAV